MKRQKADIFSDKMFLKLWRPSMIMAIGLTFGDMADAIVVGQKMGATGLAAVSLALPIYQFINVFVHGFGIGGSVKYSKLMGQGKKEEAVSSFNQILGIILGASIICAILGNICIAPLLQLLGLNAGDGAVYEACKEYVTIILYGMPILFLSYLLNYYLRNDNNQKLAATGFTVGNIADLLMNVLFVLVLNMGVFGAAISTILGQVISIIIFLPGLFGRNNTLRVKWTKMIHIDFAEAFRNFRVGFSSSIEYVWQLIFILIINHSLMFYSGEAGVAVFEMVQSMSFLISYIYEYTAKAMQPLLSTYYGEHNTRGINHVLKKGMLYGSVVGICSCIFLFAFPGVVSRLFGLMSPELIRMGNIAVRIYCIGGFVSGCSIIYENYFQSIEDEKPAYLLSTLRCSAIRIPIALILVPFGMPYLWLFYPITEYVSLGIFFVLKDKLKKPDFPEDRLFSRMIENKMDDFSILLADAEAFCEKWNADIKQKFFVNMAVEEICGIIMKRAFTKEKQGFIHITIVAMENDEFELHIRDNADSFDPFSQSQEGMNSVEEDIDVDAMGILVVKEKAKDFYYHQYQGFNTMIVRI